MSGDEIINALDLPVAARVDRRVPKSLLLERGAATAADKRRISDGIEHVNWVAALKPTTIGVAAYRDDVREYLEIAVLQMALRPGAAAPRLIELLHRAVPYPVLAVTELGDLLNLSLVHKRWSQSEAGKAVLDGDLVSTDIQLETDAHCVALAAAVALGQQSRTSLLALYQGWIDTVLALQAARLTGDFLVLPTTEGRAARADALRECTRLEVEAVRLRAAAAREKQMPRQVQLNLELKRTEAARAAALARL